MKVKLDKGDHDLGNATPNNIQLHNNNRFFEKLRTE
jgi:hypothetical protein